MAKPNCYECTYRRNIPGDAHSSCVHPDNGADADSDFFELMSLLGGVGRTVVKTLSGLKVIGDPHGIRNGWFNWPFNFDPVWLNECNGFKQK